MGMWTEVVALAKQSELAECQARLQLMLADRAAGKYVDELKVRSENSSIASLQQWFAQYERQKVLDAMNAQARSERAELERVRARDEQVALGRKWAEEQAEAASELAEERAARRAAAEQEYDDAVDELTDALSNIAAGVSEEDVPGATGLLLAAISGIPEGDAQLFGPHVHAAWRWMNHGDDPAGSFCDKEAFRTLDPDAFDSDIEYRAAVSASQAAFLLEEFAKPWTESERASLALEYAVDPAGLPDHHSGPVHTSSATVYLAIDKRRQRLVLYRLDVTQWRVEPWVFLPLASTFVDSGKVKLTSARGGTNFCLDQAGNFAFIDNKLYDLREDTLPSPVADFGDQTLLELVAGQDGAATLRVTGIQLVSAKDGTPCLLVEAKPAPGSDTARPGGWTAAVDLMQKQVKWRVTTQPSVVEGAAEGIPLPAERWLYVAEEDKFVSATWHRRVNHEPVEFALVDNVRQVARIATAADREPAYAISIEARCAVTGERTVSLDLYGRVPGFLHDPASDVHILQVDGRVHLCERSKFKVSCGVLDARDFAFTPCASEPDWHSRALLRGDVGPNRLHTLRQMYRRFDAPNAGRGPEARSALLVHRGGNGAARGDASTTDSPAFLFAPGWSRKANRTLGVIHWLSAGTSPDGRMDVTVSRDERDFPDLEAFARSHMASMLKNTPDAPAGSAYIDLFGVLAIRAVVANVAFTFFKLQGRTYILAIKMASGHAIEMHTVRQLDQQLTGIFAGSPEDSFAEAEKAKRFHGLKPAPSSSLQGAKVERSAGHGGSALDTRWLKKAAYLGCAAGIAGSVLLGVKAGLGIAFFATLIGLAAFHKSEKG